MCSFFLGGEEVGDVGRRLKKEHTCRIFCGDFPGDRPVFHRSCASGSQWFCQLAQSIGNSASCKLLPLSFWGPIFVFVTLGQAPVEALVVCTYRMVLLKCPGTREALQRLLGVLH